jgi:mannose-6-phosphate isomerase-like protein (cupin superfamily)
MKAEKTIWVLGHKVSMMKPSGDYDMVIGETPAGVSGPPPHYHEEFSELFFVLEGTMEFMVDGDIVKVKEGATVDLPPKSLHTFKNASEDQCRWVNIHSPKGFLSFFKDMGIPAEEDEAMEKSVNQSIIKKVIERAADYDMHFNN